MILGHFVICNAFDSDDWEAYRNGNRFYPEPGPNSIDVTLSNQFLKPVGGQHIDVTKDVAEYKPIVKDSLKLKPGAFVLGCTQERFDCDALIEGKAFVQMYEGRSTLGRLGIASHITAGFGDYGFKGAFTLEIVNHSNNVIHIPVGTRIGQVYFQEVLEPGKYDGSYSGEDHYNQPQAPRRA